MNEHAQVAINALECARGDDLYRARAAFRNRTPAQMDEQWGQSGKTCREILEGYEAHEAKINAAIVWVNTMGNRP
jgi:hypothetical protein